MEVLTDQAGIHDFATDGGRPRDVHQIPNPRPDRVWFWYSPVSDNVLQAEVEPYDVRGLFASEEDARTFLEWYTDRYDVSVTTYFELYSADLELEGFGRKHAVEQDGEASGTDELPEQASLRDLANWQGGEVEE